MLLAASAEHLIIVVLILLYLFLQLLYFALSLLYSGVLFGVFFLEALLVSLDGAYLVVLGGEVDLQGFLFIELNNLHEDLFFLYLESGYLFSEIVFISQLQLQCVSEFLKLFSLGLEQLFIIGFALLFIHIFVQFAPVFTVLLFVELFQGPCLPIPLFFFALEVQLKHTIFSISLAQLFLEPQDFFVLFVDHLLIGGFHFADDLDSEHILIEVGDDFQLKLLQIELFLFYEVLELMDLRLQGGYVLMVVLLLVVGCLLEELVLLGEGLVGMEGVLLLLGELCDLMFLLLLLVPGQLQILLEVNVVLNDALNVLAHAN